MAGGSDIDERLGRLEAYQAIRQLVARYAVALDSRDIAGLAALFVEDVEVGDGGRGRDALAAWFDRALRAFGVSFHLTGNHVIDLLADDRATGVLYGRSEHEVGDRWIVLAMQYQDEYQRVDDAWLFRRRTPYAFYAADVLDRPTEVAGRFDFPGHPVLDRAELPDRWTSWREFWQVGRDA